MQMNWWRWWWFHSSFMKSRMNWESLTPARVLQIDLRLERLQSPRHFSARVIRSPFGTLLRFWIDLDTLTLSNLSTLSVVQDNSLLLTVFLQMVNQTYVVQYNKTPVVIMAPNYPCRPSHHHHHWVCEWACQSNGGRWTNWRARRASGRQWSLGIIHGSLD